MWLCCGCPYNQIKMITYDDKRSLSEYIYTSLSQVVNETNIISDNHYYYLILNGKFSKQNCPNYLKKQNFMRLKNTIHRIKNINNDLLTELKKRKYSKIILMDHMDWMESPYIEELTKTLCSQLTNDGVAIFRSASIEPWFLYIFQGYELKLTCLDFHNDIAHMDRVNTYASFWKIEKC